MKSFLFVIRDLGKELEAVYVADSLEHAEDMARDDYAVDLDCSPEDVDIIVMEEIR